MDSELNTSSKNKHKAPEANPSDQLPTPDRSQSLFEPHGQVWGGRGMRLVPVEELALIRLCKEEKDNYDVNNYSKQFWASLSDLFLDKCGRMYTWQSCRRRISNLVMNRKAYWAALDKGQPPPVTFDNHEVSRAVDKWIWECDAKWEAAQRKKEQIANERAAALREKERLQAIERRQKCIKRVQNWVDTLPAPEKVEPLPRHWGEVPPKHRPSRSRAPLARSRSRSPRGSKDDSNAPATYRQRPELQSSSKIRDSGRTCRDNPRPCDGQRNDGVPTHQRVDARRHQQKNNFNSHESLKAKEPETNGKGVATATKKPVDARRHRKKNNLNASECLEVEEHEADGDEADGEGDYQVVAMATENSEFAQRHQKKKKKKNVNTSERLTVREPEANDEGDHQVDAMATEEPVQPTKNANKPSLPNPGPKDVAEDFPMDNTQAEPIQEPNNNSEFEEVNDEGGEEPVQPDEDVNELNEPSRPAINPKDVSENLPMDTTPAEPVQPTKRGVSALPTPNTEDAEKRDSMDPLMKAAIDDAVKSASASINKRIDELAENQALQNQKLRQSLKTIESAVYTLYQNIGKVVEDTFGESTEDTGEARG